MHIFAFVLLFLDIYHFVLPEAVQRESNISLTEFQLANVIDDRVI